MNPGDLVGGRYRLEAPIGQGGFGAVWRASQLPSGRAVAIKMVLAEAVAHDGLARFEREAVLAQGLSHPNTVRLLDHGRSDTGLPFLVWELLDGRSLEGVLAAEGPLSAPRVAHVARQVLGALMEAHGQGIVHRDIKPPNILLCAYPGEPDFVKVIDFGISKRPASQTMAPLTAVGTTIGTPRYMPPEQVAADVVTPATDLYALGLVMAELLTGRPVYDGDDPSAIVLAQLSPRPVPLPAVVLASPLGRIIERATQKDPALRYRSAAEMRSALEALGLGAAGDSASRVVVAASGGAHGTDATRAAMAMGATRAVGGAGSGSPAMASHAPGASATHAVPSWTAATAATAPHPDHAPPVPTAFAPSRGPTPAGGRAGWIAAVVVLGGIVVALLVLVATGRLDWRQTGRSRAREGDGPTAGVTSRPGPHRPRGADSKGKVAASVAKLTPEVVRERATAAGYKITQTDVVSTVASFNVTFGQDGTGIVQLYRMPDPMSASILDETLGEMDGTWAREGKVALYVELDPDEGAERALFDRLAR